MGEVGVAVPPEPSLMPTLDLAALLRGGPKCSITCNGKPAWFGGKVSCSIGSCRGCFKSGCLCNSVLQIVRV